MSVELKVFGGAYFPKDKALKKSPELKPLVTAVKAGTKAIAEAVMFGKLAAEHPEHIEDYFKVKIWEHREGLPCPEFDVFTSDFFEAVAVWNTNAGEPAAKQQPDTEENWQEDERAEVMKSVRLLDQHSRAACLALFGAVEEITAAQYGQVVDLINDDDGCFQRELAQAIVKEPRVLHLSTERQEELLAWVRKTMLVSTQWPDIKKAITKWLDAAEEKKLSTKNDNSDLNNKTMLRYNIALGVISRSMDFDIDSTPIGIEQRANAMLSDKNDTEVTNWFLQLSRTPGVYDFHSALIIAMIKTCEEGVHVYPAELRKYIDSVISVVDCKHPDQLIHDIACGRSSSPIPQINSDKNSHDETKPPVPVEAELPAVCPARAAELDKELNEAFAQGAGDMPDDEQLERDLAASRGEFVEGISDPADPKWVDGSAQPKIENLGGGVFSVDALMGGASNEGEKQEVPPALSEREVEIAIALNDLLAGRTQILDKADVSELLQAASQKTSDVIPLLMQDIATTELCLSPDFSDLEVQDVATTILENWSDDINVRQKFALDAIVEFRKPAPPKVQNQESVNQELVQKPESVNHALVETSLTYRQQLTIAALNGLCANPAYCHVRHDLPLMAIDLANDLIDMQDGVDAD
ncbi:exodeoxyribonuclease VIII [Enterobacter sp. 276E10]|uniref:exodeoxyribonuclease VIII n=1 Tax=Enterobacter TaxID=547 RepID=UPI002A80C51B|nr:exodeoxyribonuclease VIII [Enterobacter sp. 276E10]